MFGFLEPPKPEKELDLHCKLFTVAPAQPNICLCLNNSSGKHLSRYLTWANRVSHTCSRIRARTDSESKVKSCFPGSSPGWKGLWDGIWDWAWEGGCGLIFTLSAFSKIPVVIPEPELNFVFLSKLQVRVFSSRCAPPWEGLGVGGSLWDEIHLSRMSWAIRGDPWAGIRVWFCG